MINYKNKYKNYKKRFEVIRKYCFQEFSNEELAEEELLNAAMSNLLNAHQFIFLRNMGNPVMKDKTGEQEQNIINDLNIDLIKRYYSDLEYFREVKNIYKKHSE
jgi:hypothetical protein